METKKFMTGVLLSGLLFASCQGEIDVPKENLIGAAIGGATCGGLSLLITKDVTMSIGSTILGAAAGYFATPYFVELGYERSNKQFLALQSEATSILTSRQVEMVKDSYERTISYELANVSEIRPFGVIIDSLRSTVKRITDIMETCSKNKEYCLQKAEKDKRYRKLAKDYGALIEKIKTEFPFDIFEQRVVEIYSSEDFAKEAEVIEREIKHKEIVEVLRSIKGELNDVIYNLQDELFRVRNNISEMRDDVSANSSKLAGIENDMIDSRSLLLDLDAKLNMLRNTINILKDEAVVPEEFYSQLARIESVLISTSNLVSCLEHDVSNINNKLYTVGNDNGQTV